MTDVEHAWVNEEYEDAELNDRRRTNRLVAMAQAMAEKPTTSFPHIFEDEAELEGAYRFFNNRKVTPEGILAGHIARTVERAEDDETVLALHDSSLMKYRAGGKRKGLGTLRKGEQEFLAHVTLAVSADGLSRPLGILGLSGQKKEKRKGKKPTIQRRDKSEFPSNYDRWLERIMQIESLPFREKQVIHVADREADDYELMAELVGLNSRFVIRSAHNRRLESEGEQSEKLHDKMKKATVFSSRVIPISVRSGKDRGPDSLKTHPARKERVARVEILGSTVVLTRPRCPKTAGLDDSLSVNVVHVREIETPAGEPTIDWMLLTTEAVSSASDVERVVDIYRTRWLIEEYFKALKSGCAYEKRQLGSLHALCNALAIFAPIAWRHLLMRSESRMRPDTPATEIFSQDELYVLSKKAPKRCPLPEGPTIRDALWSIASCGGHLKRNGPPGWQTIRTGYDQLMNWMVGFYLAKNSFHM